MSAQTEQRRQAATALRPPDPQSFRGALGRFVTGVSVVAARHADIPHASTANAFSALSLDPPLVLVCLRRGSRLLDVIVRASAFAVNFLHEDQLHLAAHFANPSRPLGDAGFDGIPWTASPLGAPLLAGAVAHLDCSLRSTADGGDHVICIGKVEGLDCQPGRPLVFVDGFFARVGEWVEEASVPEAWPWI